MGVICIDCMSNSCSKMQKIQATKGVKHGVENQDYRAFG